MSKYTSQLRYICETVSGYTSSQGSSSIDEVVKKAYPKIFDNFPIFDESYREILCCKILKHFYLREIGMETYGLWKFYINRTLNEIMPYYNKMYESTLLDFDPLTDTNWKRSYQLDRESNIEGENKSDTNSSSVGKSKNAFSDTPQGSLNDIESGRYLSSGNVIKDETTNEGNGTTTYNQKDKNSDDYEENVKGKMGGKSYSVLVKEYRDILINVDLKVFDELESCFMQIW